MTAMTELWAAEMADAFWDRAGGAQIELPRDLRPAVALSLPLAIVDMPRPRVAAINRWLTERGVGATLSGRDRAVRACLLVGNGGGIVFLDGADPDDERRFSLAHEVAHYWLEHEAVRSAMVAKLGGSIVEVLDGIRAPTPYERIAAALAGMPFQPAVHLMERDEIGGPLATAVTSAERRADVLALELLAPPELVTTHVGGAVDRSAVERVLCTVFGLPRPVAAVYAGRLVPPGPVVRLAEFLRSASHFRAPAGNNE